MIFLPKRLPLRSCLVLATLFIGACATDQALNDKPRSSYLGAVGDLGLRGLYPPRHNVQIGDVFVAYDDGTPKSRTEYFIGNVDAFFGSKEAFAERQKCNQATSLDIDKRSACGLADNFQELYSQRVQIVKTKEAADTAMALKKSREDAPIAEGWRGVQSLLDSRTPIAWESLDRVAFPEIRVESGSVAAASGGGTLSAITASLGGERRLRRTITLNFPDVRTLGVPVQEGEVSLTQFCLKSGDLCTPTKIQRTLALAKGDAVACGENGIRCYLFIVTRIYATDQIIYSGTTLGSDSAAAALGLADGGSLETARDIQAAIGGDNPVTVPNVGGAQTFNIFTAPSEPAAPKGDEAALAPIPPLVTAETLSGEITLPDLAIGSTPQAKLSLLRFGARGTALRQTFEKPVVIAFDGMAIVPGKSSQR